MNTRTIGSTSIWPYKVRKATAFFWFKWAALALVLVGVIYGCGGGGGGATSGSTIAGSKIVDATGGSVSVTDPSSALAGTTVQIPAGALANPTTITISQGSSVGLPAGSLVVNFGPSGTVFAKPVTVTVKYSQQYLANNGISNPATLKVVVVNGDVSETLATVSTDTVNRTVTAQTTHFSNFVALGYSNASLSGTYTFSDYYVNSSSSNATSIVPISVPSTPYTANLTVPIAKRGFTVETGTVTFDGVGAFTISGTKNVDGVVSSMAQSGSYSVAPDGTLTVGTMAGSVLAGGSSFIAASRTGAPEVLVGVKKAGTFSNASLSGAYTFADYYVNSSSSNATSIVPINVPTTPYSNNLTVPIAKKGFTAELGTVTFDGAGGFTILGTKNVDAVVSNVTQSGSYSVAADGTLTVGTMTGSVLAGGSSFIAASRTGDPEILVGILR